MKRYDVITIGNATRDIFLRGALPLEHDAGQPTDDIELPLGAKFEVDTIVETTGGGASNAAATFGNLGLKTAFVGWIGTDQNGDAVLRELRQHHVDTRFVRRVAAAPTAQSVIVTVPHHGRTILTYRGKHVLAKDEIPFRKLNTRWLYLTSFGGNMPLLRWIIASAHDKNISIAINPGKDELQHPHFLLPLLRLCSVVMMNREEAGMLLPHLARKATLLQITKSVHKATKTLVVITDGPKGACAFDGTTLYTVGARTLRNAIEWTGAGDAFGSGFIAGMVHTHGDVKSALRIAAANAESVIQSIGAKNGLLRHFPHTGLVKVTATKTAKRKKR